jgi:hypothetical protein
MCRFLQPLNCTWAFDLDVPSVCLFIQEATAGPVILGADSKMATQRVPAIRSFKGLGQFKKKTQAEIDTAAQLAEAAAGPQTSIGLEPKVFVPFEMIPGKAPRRIVIERKKRLFASFAIEDLLKQQGVDYAEFGDTVDHATGQVPVLAIRMFILPQ